MNVVVTGNILARLRLRPRINIRCHSGAKPSAEGRWLRTRPFETLASLAPQGEVLVLRSARSARLEAPGSPPLRTKIGFSRFWQTYCRSRLKPRSTPPRNDALGKLDTFASASLTQAELVFVIAQPAASLPPSTSAPHGFPAMRWQCIRAPALWSLKIPCVVSALHRDSSRSGSIALMDERQTARLIGLALGLIFGSMLVLNALASF